MSTANERVDDFESIHRMLQDMYVDGSELIDPNDDSVGTRVRKIKEWLEGRAEKVKTEEGMVWQIPIDSRSVRHNPFYIFWKSKSFHEMDISKFFAIFDILYSPNIEYTSGTIQDKILPSMGFNWDDGTVETALTQYCNQGLLIKEGNLYRRAEGLEGLDLGDFLNFFSEVAPCGVLGSFLLDKMPPQESVFRFKHHYLVSALDSEVLAHILNAIYQHKTIRIKNRKGNCHCVIPLQIRQSVQTGRQYLAAYNEGQRNFQCFRIDQISLAEEDGNTSVTPERWQELRGHLDELRGNMWGVTLKVDKGWKPRIKHVEFLVHVNPSDPFEFHVIERLNREKRGGTVEKIDECTYKFSADVCSTKEMKPWIRSFFGYISDLKMDEADDFVQELEDMYRMYDVGKEA